ncbi:MAG: hypothetical protein V4615_01760, partial [Bacteroidota bacterium]
VPALSTLKHQELAASRLLRSIEKFIAQEQWQKNEPEMKRYQLAGFKALDLSHEFDKGLAKEMKQLEESGEQNIDTFFEKHLLTELSLSGFKVRLNRNSRNDIMPIVKTLDEFYALKKLRYLCEAINRKQFLGTATTHEEQHLLSLLKILEPYTTPAYPYLFVNVYRMLSAETYQDSNLYYLLIKQYASRQTEITDTLREVQGYAINQCLLWNGKGYPEAGDEYLWWIEWRQQHQLLFENATATNPQGNLMPVTFRNIISIAVINDKKPAWIEQAIEKYAPHLPPEYSETYVAFAQGLHHYALGQHKKALRFLLMAQAKEDAVFNSTIRRWYWLCLYELDPGDIDALHNHLLAFEKSAAQ